MFKHFRLEEFNCTHTNSNSMDEAFLHKLDELREKCGFPFKITSGYRDASHPSEVVKAAPTWTPGQLHPFCGLIVAETHITNNKGCYI